MSTNSMEYAFIGGLREDYCITHDNRLRLHVLGGNAVYSAVGAKIWGVKVGVISRVGLNFPESWIDELADSGLDVSGIRILQSEQDTRTFYAYLTPEQRVDINPAAHFLHIGETLPKALIDYRSSTEGQSDRRSFGPLAVRPEDLPPAIGKFSGVHLAPGDYLSHQVLPLALRDAGVGLMTLDPSERYMEPGFRDELPGLLKGLTAFLPSEAEARAFFLPESPDVPEMANEFSEMGCPIVLIKQGAQGQYAWDARARKGWWIPAYPASVRDVTGAGDAFCGGFLVGLSQSGDVVEAAVYGSISASLVIQGAGALYALDAAPGLAEARAESLRAAVHQA